MNFVTMGPFDTSGPISGQRTPGGVLFPARLEDVIAGAQVDGFALKRRGPGGALVQRGWWTAISLTQVRDGVLARRVATVQWVLAGFLAAALAAAVALVLI